MCINDTPKRYAAHLQRPSLRPTVTLTTFNKFSDKGGDQLSLEPGQTWIKWWLNQVKPIVRLCKEKFPPFKGDTLLYEKSKFYTRTLTKFLFLLKDPTTPPSTLWKSYKFHSFSVLLSLHLLCTFVFIINFICLQIVWIQLFDFMVNNCLFW